MDRSAFAQILRDAIVDAVRVFSNEHAAESPYGFAVIEGQSGNYLGYAIATEEGLKRVAAGYDALGYRYNNLEWEQVPNQERLAVWLRWANPDDGWHYGDFAGRFEIPQHLELLVAKSAFGEDAEDLEEFCTDVLASLQTDTVWQELQDKGTIVVGVTAGEDPRDFLRTATRSNSFSVVRQLWSEQLQADEYSSKIKSPKQ